MKTIPLTKGMVALVDDEDYEYLSQWKWHVSEGGRDLFYAERVEIIDGKRIKFSMHRVLLRLPEGRKVDHEDRNSLNNQKYNLRDSAQIQNTQNRRMSRRNSSGFKGVCWNKRKQTWHAQIGHNWKIKSIGFFTNPRSAAIAYDRKAVELFGEFAATNKKLNLL